MPHSLLIDATDLTIWANRRDSQSCLPHLVRRLILSSAGNVTCIHVRAGEGVLLAGWDGLAEAQVGDAFVPAGLSVWEMGTNLNPKDKAEDDYAKRTRDPQDITSAEVTFVFVTPRRWAGKADWMSEKNQDGTWREVRAYDADDIEAWLESSPPVHAWISTLAGKPTDALQDLESYWADWAGTTLPPLSANLIIAGPERDACAQRVLEHMTGEPRVLGLRADSRDEALAFLAASIHRMPDVEQEAVLARAIVVRDATAWRQIVASDRRLLLIPLFEGADVARAVRSEHTVIVPMGTEGVVRAEGIDLPRLRWAAAQGALREMGVTEERASSLATVARRSLLSLRRKLAFSPEIQRPMWAHPDEARTILHAMLAGAWDQARPGDRDALAALVGRSYEEVEQEMVRWVNVSDPLARHIGTTWLLASQDDAWTLLSRYLTANDFERFKKVARTVWEYTETNAAGPRRRPVIVDLASPHGHSTLLREGLADTLALMAMRGAAVDGLSGQDHVDIIVQGILARANADATGDLWASLSDVLPRLAEAAPDVFLDAVDAGISDDTPILLRLVESSNHQDTLLGSAPHTGLLLALETLAWQPDYLGRVALILARLSRGVQLDQRIGNRPDRSLRHIFLLWHPQTASSLDQRLAVLDALRLHEPVAAWDLLVRLLPHQGHNIGHPTSMPRWRDWRPDAEPGITVADWSRGVQEVADRLIVDVGCSGRRWRDLIQAMGNLPLEVRDGVIARLSDADPATFDVPDRQDVWDALRALVAQHRQFRDALWAMPAPQVDQLADLCQRWEPVNLAERYAWLFSTHPRVPTGDGDPQLSHLDALNAAQDQAVRALYQQGGVRAIVDLAGTVERPHNLGWTVGKVDSFGAEEAALLADLATPEWARRMLVRGYVAGRFNAGGGWDWVDARLDDPAARWTPAQRAEFLASLPPSERAFARIERDSDETKGTYWTLFGISGLPEPSDHAYVATQLLAFGHPHTAVDLLVLALQRTTVSPDLVAEALERAAQTPLSEASDLNTVIYDVATLLDYLAASELADTARLAQLEFAYLSILRYHRPAGTLHRELARDPAFFVDLVSRVFKAQHEEQGEGSEDDASLALLGYELLSSWRDVPGRRDDGSIDLDALAAWVKAAREMLAAGDRVAIGDEMIGQILGQAPSEADGIWPAIAVRDLIEATRSAHLEAGVEVAVRNGRGVTVRGLTDGGAQERILVERYRAYAQGMSTRWPRTAAMLRRLAHAYEADARREDISAELVEDRWQ